MPIYEFKCDSCSHIDEHLMKMTDPAPEKCSLCGAKVHKIMSMSSFSLKGSGWYATDYKNPAPVHPPSDMENKESKPTETTEPVKTPEATKETKETKTNPEPVSKTASKETPSS